MNALPSTKWLALGLGTYAIAALACSAEASSPPPQDDTPSTSAGKSNGAGGSGTALPTAGTTGALPVAGTSTGQGGTPPVGTAGSAPVGTAGTPPAAGGMMGGALTSCPVPPAAGALTDLLIDDLEDGDNGVAKVGGRSGYWYTFADTLGSTIIPKPDPGGTLPLVPGSTMCHGGMKCVIVSGATVPGMPEAVPPTYAYAAVGFDFSNAKKPCVYNASAYSGIKFWARGDVPITIKLTTTATAVAMDGGTCAAECNGGFSPAGVDVVLTPTWQQIDVNFATAKEPSWVLTPKTLNKASVLGMQIQVPPGQPAFSIAIDDITFY